MKESIEKRINNIKSSEEPEDLKKHLCPFFQGGGCPECVTCSQTEADLEECKELYLRRIVVTPIEVWNEDFEKVLVQERDKVPLEDTIGIGVTCDNCYMYDKCPHYKKGYNCAIDWASNKPSSPTEFMDFLISVQYERVKRSMVFEKVDGGVPDAGLSNEMDRLQNLVLSKVDMGRDRLSVNIEATGSSTPATGGGILAKLFGGAPSTPALEAPKEESIVVEEIKEPEKIKRKTKKE